MNRDWLRRKVKPVNKKSLKIEVSADSMRVGKTTVVKVLGEGLVNKGLKVKMTFEDWEHNPYLKKSYQNPAQAFLESQKWFIRRKYEQVSEGLMVGVSIQDLSPEGDYNYALTNCQIGRMSKEDFEKYQKWFRSLAWEKLKAPDLLIYLKADDDVLIKRAKAAARGFEVVDGDYFLALKQVNREWLKAIRNKWRILEIDTNHHDYAKDEAEKADLVNRVIKKVRGWKGEDYLV